MKITIELKNGKKYNLIKLAIRVLYNIVYFGFIGAFFTWVLMDETFGIKDYIWWIKVIVLTILINVHTYIFKIINK